MCVYVCVNTQQIGSFLSSEAVVYQLGSEINIFFIALASSASLWPPPTIPLHLSEFPVIIYINLDV